VSIGLSPLEMGLFALPSTSGIVFNAALTQPSTAGSILFVQYLNNYNLTYNNGSGCAFSYGPGLDSYYPYDSSAVGAPQASTNDSPGIILYSDASEATASFNATMYLMWQPNASASIPVPLAYIGWQWSGDAVQTNGAWSLKSSSRSANQFVVSSGFPAWTKTVQIGQPPCH